MFKFKALIAKKGNYFYNERFIPYKNSEVITEDKEEAEYLRNNRGFEIVVAEEKKEISELEKLKAEAIALGLKPHHKAGVGKLQEMIKEFHSKANDDEKKEKVE